MEVVRTPTENQRSSHDTVNLREVWRLLRFHKMFLALCVGSAMLLGTLYFWIHGPRFRATVDLTLTTNPSPIRDILPVDTNDEVNNKMSVLNGLFHSPDFSDRILETLVQASKEHKQIYRPGKRYLFMEIVNEKAVKGTKEERRQAISGQIMAHLTFVSNATRHEITITAETFDPILSAFLANAAAKALVEVNGQRLLRKVRGIKKFLDRETIATGEKLQSFEALLVDFQRANHMTSADETERSAYQLMNRNLEQLVSLQVQYDSGVEVVKKLEEELKKIKENVDNPSVSTSNMYLSQLQHRLTMLHYEDTLRKNALARPAEDQGQLEGEIKSITETYKKALDSRGELKELATMTPLEYYQELEKSLGQLRKDNRKLRSELDVLLNQQNKRRSEIVTLSSQLQKLTDLKRNVTLASDLYVSLRKRLQDIEIEEAATINDLSVLSEAETPSQTASLRLRAIWLVAALLGMGIGLFLIFLKETFIPFVRHRQDLENMGLRVAAEIPEVGSSVQGLGHLNLKRASRPLLVQHERPASYEADIIRSIRSRLAALDNRQKTDGSTILQMTSAESGCGKTFIAANVAFALSKARHKTLLIDLDLRQPSVDRFFFQAKPQNRLKGTLGAEVPIETLITPVAPNLDVIFAEKTISPVDFLESNFIPELLLRTMNDYEFILIDGPPVLAAVDAAITAQFVHFVFFVVEHRRTFREDVRAALDKLAEMGQPRAMAILNRVHVEFSLRGSDQKYQVVKSEAA